MSIQVPRPHVLRRALHLANALLLLACLAVAAHYLVEVRPAGAASPRTGTADTLARVPASWRPAMPVNEAEMRALWLDRSWPLSGPLPVEPTTTSIATPVAERDLVALGDVLAVMDGPPGYAQIFFRFDGGPSRWFGLGEIIRADAKAPARFRLRTVERVAQARYRITYETRVGDGWREAYLAFDGQPTPLARGGVRIPEPRRSLPDTTGEGAPAVPRVIDAASPAPTLDACRPTLHDDGPRRKRLVLDDPTRAWIRSRGARVLADEVKLTPVSDPAGRRVIGLRPVFRRTALADVFHFERGDVLVSVDGRGVRSRADLLALARDLDGERLVTLVIDRRGRQITYVVDPRDSRVRRDAIYLAPPR